jgi:hypothetical protein
MLKRVVENRATIEKEVPPEKATKVSPARVDIPRNMDLLTMDTKAKYVI